MIMRNILLLASALLFAGLCACSAGSGNGGNAQADSLAVDTVDCGPRIKFDTAVFNFGRILQGEQVSTVFRFTNIGQSDLILQRVETSCGCTVPEYNREPVAPGKQGSIRVRFDSDGKEGTQYKTVKVISNCKDNIFDLVVTGEVEVR